MKIKFLCTAFLSICLSFPVSGDTDIPDYVPQQLQPYIKAMLNANLLDSQVLKFNNEGDVRTLDPPLVMSMPEQRILRALLEGLTIYDPKTLVPCPAIAKNWEISEDGLTYTFFLRQAKWSNGDTVSAQDFVVSWERLLNPGTKSDLSFLLFCIKNAREYNEGKFKTLVREAKLLSKPGGDGTMVPAGTVLEILQAAQENHIFVRTPDGKEGWIKEEVDILKIDINAFSKVEVKAKDNQTLVVSLNAPAPYFLSLCASTALFPVHYPTIEKYGKEAFTASRFVSNGPFIMKEMNEQNIVLEKNPDYWMAPVVRLQKIICINVPELIEAYEKYMDGELDWLPYVSINDSTSYLFKRKDFYLTPFLGTTFYRFNVTMPPFNDSRVRRALAMTVDKNYICWFIIGNGVLPAKAFVPPGLPGYEEIKGIEYDPDKAKKLLAEAGYPNGRGFPKSEILCSDNFLDKYIAQDIIEMWHQRLGIELTIKTEPWDNYLAVLKVLGYRGMAYSGWFGDYLDPSTFIEMFFSTDPNNETGWANQDYDRLVALARSEKDTPKRFAYLKEAETILVEEEAIIVPMYYHVTRMMLHPRVKGLYPNIYSAHLFQFVYLEKE